jgi:hypothetical protein
MNKQAKFEYFVRQNPFFNKKKINLHLITAGARGAYGVAEPGVAAGLLLFGKTCYSSTSD